MSDEGDPGRNKSVAADVKQDFADQPVSHRFEAGKCVTLKNKSKSFLVLNDLYIENFSEQDVILRIGLLDKLDHFDQSA